MRFVPSSGRRAGPAWYRKTNPDFRLLSPRDLSETLGTMRISAAISLMAGLLLLAGPGEGKETSVLARVEAGVTETGAALAGPKPFVDIVCPLMQQEAEQHGLPP